MAAIISLGLHSPSALPYLVREGVLPADPAPSLYKWTVTPASRDGLAADEELLVTDHCVVWSQGAIVRRIFRFDVEGQKVAEAVLTTFSEDGPKPEQNEGGGQATAAPNSKPIAVQGATNRSRRRSEAPNPIVNPLRAGARGIKYDPQPHLQSSSGDKRALVVFLKSRAHVYFLSGESHVINLPFEVELALPAPKGLILQRKVPRPETSWDAATPKPPPPPQNSFASSQQQPWSAPSSQESAVTLSFNQPPRLIVEPSTVLSSDIYNMYGPESKRNEPRLFSLTDPLVEFGLLVTTTTSLSSSFSQSRGSGSGSLTALDPLEEILYVSSSSEFASLSQSDKVDEPCLVLAVTANHQTRRYTVWNLTYAPPETPGSMPSMKRTPTSSGTLSRRRSSGPGAGTGATTPVGYGPSGRESFGGNNTQGIGAGRGQLSNASSQAETGASRKSKGAESFSVTLDPDFTNDGVSSQTSRRISSLVARAELSTSQSRTTFSDMASGNTGAPSANIAGGSFRRGDSLGGYSDAGSIAGHAKHRRGGSRGSFGINGYDHPVDELLEELNATGDFEGFEDMGIHETGEGLRREIIMTNLQSFHMDLQPNIGSFTAAHLNNRPRVFTIVQPRQEFTRNNEGDTVILCIADSVDRKLLLVKFHVQLERHNEASRKGGRRESGKTTAPRDTSLRYVPYFVDVTRPSGDIDAIRVADGDLSRILVLKETDDGVGELSLESPWSPVFKVKLPANLAIFNPFQVGDINLPSRRREGGFKRVLSQGPAPLIGFDNDTFAGKVNVADKDGKRHRLTIRLKPRDHVVAKALDIFRFILPRDVHGGEAIVVAFWAVTEWLRQEEPSYAENEWATLVIVLFLLRVPFMQRRGGTPSNLPAKRKRALLRSSSSGVGGHSSADFDEMMRVASHRHGPSPEWLRSPSWNWIIDKDQVDPNQSPMHSSQFGLGITKSPSRSNPLSSQPPALLKKDEFLVSCLELAVRFARTAPGVEAIGDRGYLPTASCQPATIRSTAIPTVLVGLHLFREELKLDIATAEASRAGVRGLAPVLAQLGQWLGWQLWGWGRKSYYTTEDVEMQRWSFDDGMESEACPHESMS